MASKEYDHNSLPPGWEEQNEAKWAADRADTARMQMERTEKMRLSMGLPEPTAQDRTRLSNRMYDEDRTADNHPEKAFWTQHLNHILSSKMVTDKMYSGKEYT